MFFKLDKKNDPFIKYISKKIPPNVVIIMLEYYLNGEFCITYYENDNYMLKRKTRNHHP